MNTKKITAFAAAMVIAAGICTGVPTGTGTGSLLAVTAEAATEQSGSLEAAVTHSGVSIDMKWKNVSNAAYYNVMVMYSTDAIPFASMTNVKFFALKKATPTADTGSELSLSIFTAGLPLDIDGKPVHYSVQITPMTKDDNLVSDTLHYSIWFDSLDDLEKTTFNADGTINYSDDTSKSADENKGTKAEAKTETKEETKKVSAPKNFKAKKTSSSVTLSWDAADGADMYRVYKYNPETKKYEKYKDVKNAKCTIKGLDANTKYKFKVVSYDKNKDGKYVKGESSKAVSVTTKK